MKSIMFCNYSNYFIIIYNYLNLNEIGLLHVIDCFNPGTKQYNTNVCLTKNYDDNYEVIM